MGVCPCPFHRQKDGSAPFATDTHALNEAYDGEEDCTPDADLIVARHEPDRKRRQASQQKRCNQCPFAANAVSVVSENCRTNRTSNEADGVDGASSTPTNGSDLGKKSFPKTKPVTVL